MTNSLIDTYLQNAIEHGKATDSGNHKKANKYHDELIKTFKKLREEENSWVSLLENLMKHDNDHVKCWAATHLLSEIEAKATKVLEELKNGNGISSFNAEMVLDEWKNGTLQLP